MANRFLNNIRINDAYTFPASDGNDGQVITTDGAGNLAFENISPDAASVIYRDNFTGDGSTVTFDLQNSITDEDQTHIYIDGVYQEKSTYSISGTTITFTTAPISGHSVEVISISSINTGPTVLYQDNFTGNGSDTAFTLGQEIDNEIKTFIFLNGVYQFKNTYTVDGATLTFDTAPANGVAIEVVSIASAVQSDSLEAGAVIIPVKNTHTTSISKGTPVYITGNVGASERLQIAPADASNSAKMPAAGLLLTTLAVNAEGYVITGGYLRNLTTDTIDGTSTSPNNTVYVKPGGGLTMTKPTGSNLIQNIAKVARSAANSGSLLVSSILRTNDVPNLTTGKIWVGDGNTVESTVVHLDESNNRLGINNNSPNYSLDVTGDANISSNVIIGGNLTVDGTQTILNTQTVEVEDNILQLNTTQGTPDTATATTSGISIYRGNGVTQASFIFDDADDTWDLTNNLVVDGNATFAGDISIPVAKKLYFGGGSHTYIGEDIDDRLRFFTGGTEFMRFTEDTSDTINFYTDATFAGSIILSQNGTNFEHGYAGNGLVLSHYNVGPSNAIVSGGASNPDTLFINNGGSASDWSNVSITGNVGINDTTPDAKLHITSTSGDHLRLAYSDGYYWDIARESADGRLSFTDNANGEAVSIKSGGNVGIGTTSPNLSSSGTALTVNSSSGANAAVEISDGGTLAGLLWGRSGTGVNVWSIPSIPLIFGTANSEKMRITSGGDVEIQGGDIFLNSGTNYNDKGVVYFSNERTAIISDIVNLTANGDTSLDFQTRSAGTRASAMFIDEFRRVGIGTNSPVQPLHVNGQVLFRTTTVDGGKNRFQLIPGGSSDAANLYLYYGNSGDGTVSVRINAQGNSYLNGGNVGIGTTSPLTTLDLGINGGQKFYVYANGSIRSGMGIDLSGSSRELSIFHTSSNNIDGNISFGLRNETSGQYVERMRVTGAGNVGIGTTLPAHKLHVSGRTLIEGSGYLLDVQATDTNNTRLQFYVDGNDTNIISGYDTTAKPMRFWTGGSERMRILSSGGITFNGDTAAANALDDYEEGTFTPAIGDGTYTYSYRRGHYQKVGNTVHIHIGFKINSASSVGTGVAHITGLPFAGTSWGSYQEPHERCGTAGLCVTANLSYNLSFYISNNSAQLNGRTSANNADTQVNSNQVWQNGTFIKLQLSYTVS